ncbi:MAG: class I SAM-dependent methyltransferase [Thermoguttaceae bacterium]
METIYASVYDYPKYYDVLFNSSWKEEYRFLRACFARHGQGKIRRLFEPACGTGRLLIKFARAGYRVAGNDLNPRAIDYCNRRLRRNGYPETALVGDMCDFQLQEKAHAAFNTINSFRHLQTEQQAADHLRCMADALVPGGLYVLGLHLTPKMEPLCDQESFTAQRGSLCINSDMETLEVDRSRRTERIRFVFDISTGTRSFRLADEFIFRTYSAGQFSELLEKVPQLEIVETYDFAYDISLPVAIDDETEDVIYVLRKKPGT